MARFDCGDLPVPTGFLFLPVLILAALLSGCAGQEPVSVEDGARRELLLLEEQRGLADRNRLATLLREPNAELRAATAQALGRIREAWCVPLLSAALGDSDAQVRVQSAWALGQLQGREEKASATAALLTRIGDRSAAVRARCYQALGKVGDPQVVEILLRGLSDADAEVRQHAALGLNRQQLRAERSPEPWPDAQKERMQTALAAGWKNEIGRPGAWRYVYALANLRLPAAIPALDGAFEPGASPETRVFALRGLAELIRAKLLEPGSAELRQLRERFLWVLKDPEPRLRIEAALALGDPSRSGRNSADPGTPAPFESPEVLEALAGGLQDENPQVARVCALGLGHFPNYSTQARQVLQIAETSLVPALQSAAILAQARLLGSYYASTLAWHAKAEEIHRALAAAAGLRFVKTSEAMPVFETLLARPEPRARIAALSQFEKHGEDRKCIDLALSALTDPVLAVREAATAVFAEIGDASSIPALRTMLQGSPGEDSLELRQEVLKAIARIAPDQESTRDLLVEAMSDPSYAVRTVAHRLLVERAGNKTVPELERPALLRPSPMPEGAEFERFLASRPRLELETTRGTLRFELWPELAPMHVWNLLALCQDNGYADRLWHRVVPNFVVQGGDSTGTGSGSRSSFGYRLRDELGARPFVTGTLGMPRSSEPDTGGEQIFVTTIPTPHLDGRYTAFGQLIGGLEILLQLSVEDRITGARIQR
jgi:cyclophilin family peptidyl-prolyl cis-trans isomerase/HEAT repeat protein